MTSELELANEEIERLWAEEAVCRDLQLDSGAASSRDAVDVFIDARARIANRLSPDE